MWNLGKWTDSIWLIGGLFQKAVNDVTLARLHKIARKAWTAATTPLPDKMVHQVSFIFGRTGNPSRHQDHQLKSTQLNYNKKNKQTTSLTIHQVITSIFSGFLFIANQVADFDSENRWELSINQEAGVEWGVYLITRIAPQERGGDEPTILHEQGRIIHFMRRAIGVDVAQTCAEFLWWC